MRVPLSWLADHVDVDVSAADLAERLTFAGIEVETIHRVGEELAGILTARVLEIEQHPDADRLVLVRIDAGGEERSVVCGARNFAAGDVVPWAAPGASPSMSTRNGTEVPRAGGPITRFTSRAWNRIAIRPGASLSTAACSASVQTPDGAHWFKLSRDGSG